MATDSALQAAIAWMESSFRTLPGSTDDLFQRLWSEGRIAYLDSPSDEIDEYGARLVCAALSRRKPTFIALPDHLPRRPALLFATALIRDWVNIIKAEASLGTLPRQRVLYLGTTVGIREQLARVKVDKRTWDLADVFQPRHLTRDGRARTPKPSDREASALPLVYTAYAPALPRNLIESVHPAWIAMDCADANEAHWLPEALATAKRLDIPVLGWGQNPLSTCVNDFIPNALIWRWPPSEYVVNLHPVPQSTATRTLQDLLVPSFRTTLQPLILDPTSVSSVASKLQHAGLELWRARRLATSRLADDAVAIHSQLLRAIEMLSVPVAMHDAEAPNHWGIQPFTRLLPDCRRFREACRQASPEIVRHLEPAAGQLELVLDEMRSTEPPLWRALTNTCVTDPPKGQAQIIIFQSRAAKRMFLLGLLARFNVSLDDLNALRTHVLSLDELGRRWRLLKNSRDEAEQMFQLDPALRWAPLLVGVPSLRAVPKLSPVFLQEHAEFLVYPHQQHALGLRVEQAISNIDSDIARELNVVARLRDSPPPELADSSVRRFRVLPPQYLEISAARSQTQPQDLSLWVPADATEEVSELFTDEDDPTDEEEEVFSDIDGGPEPSEVSEWTATALRLDFTGEWRATFAPDDQLNVVLRGPSGHHSEARYVRSVRPGDQVVLIHGQRRQSLYDLIISRVHRHPSIELHLALIRRWQDDALAAYEEWHKKGGNVDDLLTHMRTLGSTLISPLTIRNWLARRTIAPDDREDLRRLAETLNLVFVREHYRSIDRAAHRLRGLHRGLANRINRWLEQRASGNLATDDNETFDQELGLRFSDFRDSLLFLDVRSIQELEGPFLRSHLGRVERTVA